jgi:hypothetical protein
MNDMKHILKAIAMPAAVAILLGTGYVWKMIHVWPPNKSSWLEEGIYMMAFHAICLIVLLPVLIWCDVKNWKKLTVLPTIMSSSIPTSLRSRHRASEGRLKP